MRNIVVLFIVLFLSCEVGNNRIDRIDIIYNEKPATYEDSRTKIFFALSAPLEMNVKASNSLKMNKYNSSLKSGNIEIDDYFYLRSIDTIENRLILKGYSLFNPKESSITLNDYYVKSKDFFLDDFSLIITDNNKNLYEFGGLDISVNYVFNKKVIDSIQYDLIKKHNYGPPPVDP